MFARCCMRWLVVVFCVVTSGCDQTADTAARPKTLKEREASRPVAPSARQDQPGVAEPDSSSTSTVATPVVEVKATAVVETKPSAKTLERGAEAFAAGSCAKCHMKTGRGGERGPDLTDDQWDHCDGSVAGILAVLKSGVPREKLRDPNRPFAMNPVTRLVPDEEDLAALAAYVWTLSRS